MGTFLGGPFSKDYNIYGSILGSPVLGNYNLGLRVIQKSHNSGDVTC